VEARSAGAAFAAASAVADTDAGVCARGAESGERRGCVRPVRVDGRRERRGRVARLRAEVGARVSAADDGWPASSDDARTASGRGAIGRRLGRGTAASLRAPAVGARSGEATSAAVPNAASATTPAIVIAAVIETPEASEAKSGRLASSIVRGPRRGGDRIAGCIGTCGRTLSAVSWPDESARVTAARRL
jgi:hypothetical protein